MIIIVVFELFVEAVVCVKHFVEEDLAQLEHALVVRDLDAIF